MYQAFVAKTGLFENNELVTMPSPFPGMDPYLESPEIWRDCHLTLVIAMRAQLNAVLPKNYFAAADRYVWIHEPEAEERAFLKIFASKSRRLVTVVELLSPSEKRIGNDGKSKRIDYLTEGVNVVEIDLLRGGIRLPLSQPFPDAAHYYVLIARAAQWPTADAWFFSIRDPFPIVPVPLLPDDSDCSLHLRECLDRAFEEGRYSEELAYNLPPQPPLNSADSEWATALLHSA